MTINPIETHYAGCRFRSRLEARWAVFFDYLKIPWEYEPQGMHVTWRLDWDNRTFPYLPDFWLPEHEVWGEVKGSLDLPEVERLLNTAASLSSNNGAGCHDAGGHDLVVFGFIQRPMNALGDRRFPVRLHMHKGLLDASAWPIEEGCGGLTIADDMGGANDLNGPDTIDLLINGIPVLAPASRYDDAFTAARSARFEYGESP